MRSAGLWCLTISLLLATPRRTLAAEQVAGKLIVFNDNGAWCWYQDQRVLMDPANGTLLIASVAAPEGADGSHRSGDVDVVTYHLAGGATERFVLHHGLKPQDDHNVAALMIRPDGKYLAAYSRHNQDGYTYWRVSTRPHDGTAWDEEKVFIWKQWIGANHVTYNNLFYLSAERRTYDFCRAVNADPTILISSDQGDTWSYGGKLLTEPRVGYVNGYVRYASNGVDRIDLLTTEHHPRDFNNSIYHGYVQAGKLHRSDGTVLDDNVLDDEGQPQTRLTRVFAANSTFGSAMMTHAWTVRLRLDGTGRPYGLISCRANDVPENSNFTDHRLFYVRFDGTQWHAHEMAKLGAPLFASEQDYTGLGDVDGEDPNRAWVSTTINPRDGSTLKVHEIFEGVTHDGGETWAWSAVTSNSAADNLRPIVCSCGPGKRALLWFRGTMTRSQHYNCAIVGLLE